MSGETFKLTLGSENAAPSSALPLGSSRMLSPTRLTKVDPSGPAHVTRLLNTVLAIVAITPEDRIKKATEKEGAVKAEAEEAKVKPDGEVKAEQPEAETGGEGEVVKAEEGEEKAEAEDEDEDEVPFREEIGYREILGFIVM